ncbi:MAG: hypothetical protein ACRYFR_09030 [Janthinobacterium lividum]
MGTMLANALLLLVRTGLYFANRTADGLINGMYARVRSANHQCITARPVIPQLWH